MPWTGKTFRAKHNKALSPTQASKAAVMANAILASGASEGMAIATANARVKGKARPPARAAKFKMRMP